MEWTKAVEDYLKAIYKLQAQESLTNASLAERLGVSAASVSAMVKRLEGAELLDRSSPRALALTGRGEAEALRVIRRHRIIETFLHRFLDVPWDEVHDEAEVLEHAISDRLEDRMAKALGHPVRDPHGDPIPPKDGAHHESWPQALDDAPAASWFLVERVSDREAEVLRYLAELGLVPGAVVHVEERLPFGGPLWIQIDDERRPLGAVLARCVFGSCFATVDAARTAASDLAVAASEVRT